MTHELIINGKPYEFTFGIGFLKAINEKATAKVPNSNYVVKTGGRYVLAQVMSGDIEVLIDCLLLANKGHEPRLTYKEICDHIENEDTDIEELFEQVKGFFSTANALKILYKELTEMTAEEKK